MENQTKDFNEINSKLFAELATLKKDSPEYSDKLGEIFKANEALITWKMKPYLNRKDYEDIRSQMKLNLIKAITTFDIEKDINFSTFANYYIEFSTRRYVTKENKIIKPSRAILSKIQTAKEVLKSMGVDEPTNEQLSEIANVSVNEIIDTLFLLGDNSDNMVLSINNNVKDSKSNSTTAWADLIASDEDITSDYNRKESVEKLNLAMNYLPNVQKEILKNTYYNELTYAQIAKIFDTSATHVSRIIQSAQNNLKILLSDEVFALLQRSEQIIKTCKKLPKTASANDIITTCNIKNTEFLKLVELSLFKNTTHKLKDLSFAQYDYIPSLNEFNEENINIATKAITQTNALSEHERQCLISIKSRATRIGYAPPEK